MLLIVDPQVDFITGSLPVPGAEKAMNSLAGYILRNRSRYSMIVVTADHHPADHCSFREQGGQWPTHCVAHSDGASIWPPLAKAIDMSCIPMLALGKGRDSDCEQYSAFDDPMNVDIMSLNIDSLSIDRIDICGLAGDVCVRETLKQGVALFGRGLFHVLPQFSPKINPEVAIADDLEYFRDYPIITSFTDDDLYKFTMCCAIIDNFPRAQVKYRFFDRDDTVYPPGFAADVMRQLRYLEEVTITDEEIDFMKRRCGYIPHWFYNFLKGYRYDPGMVRAEQDAEGHLHIEIEGGWSDAVLLEVKLLAIVSELYNMRTGRLHDIDYPDFAGRSAGKAFRLIRGDCRFSDFGTRRRASFKAQDVAVKSMSNVSRESDGPGAFVGTSNVYLAMKHDLVPVGTMAHEFISAIAGMFGPQMANHLAMQAWSATYRGALGTFLYDTYGWDIFSLNFSEDFANMFKGLRVDSGDNRHELDLIVEKYRSLGIDSRTKQVVFSNALSTDSALEIQKYACDKCMPSYGIGTHFTNDFPGIRPLNIVIKLVAVKITESWTFYNPTCKLSEDEGKHTGDPEVVRRFKEILHLPDHLIQRALTDL